MAATHSTCRVRKSRPPWGHTAATKASPPTRVAREASRMPRAERVGDVTGPVAVVTEVRERGEVGGLVEVDGQRPVGREVGGGVGQGDRRCGRRPRPAPRW